MKLINVLGVIPLIFCLLGCPVAGPDDDDSAGDDDDSSMGDDDDSASAIMGETRIFIERNCDDMRDNDRDGHTDCSDFDCNQAPDCNGF
tara:strand:- start:625 stop:891 length:267 start_codon:yes stop_codon:yes gene_type:complete